MISDDVLESTQQHCAHLMHDTTGGEISAEQSPEGVLTFQYWNEDSDPDEDEPESTITLKPCGTVQEQQLYEYAYEDGSIEAISTLCYKTIVALLTT